MLNISSHRASQGDDGGAPVGIAARAVGVGLKAPHYEAALAGGHELDFFEVHAENFMGDGGPPLRWLDVFAERYPLSIHGVCLSLAGRDPLDKAHLARLARLVDRVKPALLSEHLAWSADGGVFLNDLLPPPLTPEALLRIADRIDAAQSTLRRQILIENPAQYLDWTASDIPEPAFLNELAARTGCGLLLDVNNVFVSASNLKFDAASYVDSIDGHVVGEIHLAGHVIDGMGEASVRIDNHGSPICAEVFSLFERLVRRIGPRPAVVERDTNIPPFETLAGEARRARIAMERASDARRAHARV